uniref:Large ribosomal subunit protein uL10 n=1 Tax=Ignisphaera aggregans TaxID=334771 RepID=A0A7C2ZUJ4_9CREN
MKAKFRAQLETLIKTYNLAKGKPEEEHVRPSIQKKKLIIEEAKKLLTSYRTLILLDNTATPTKVYRYIRQRYGDIFYLKMIKSTLLIRAMRELGLPNADELVKYLSGSNMLLFTNLNPFEAKLLLDKINVTHKINPGEKIEHEIVVPPIRTDLKPGPIMSLFGRLRIPIQVRDGVIWITKESTLAKAGDVVTPELASLFDKLGIEPKIIKPKIKVAYEKGLVVPPDQLVVDVEGTRNNVAEGVRRALSLAVELVIPEPDIVKLALSRAYLRACGLAVELGVMSKDTAPMVISAALRKAYTLASVLAQKVPDLVSIVPQATPQPQQAAEEKAEAPKEEKKEEKSEVAEEQLAEGLSALFG